MIEAISKLKTPVTEPTDEPDDNISPVIEQRQTDYSISGRATNRIAAESLTLESDIERDSKDQICAPKRTSTDASVLIEETPKSPAEDLQSKNLSEANGKGGDRIGSKEFAGQESQPQETVAAVYKKVMGQYPQTTKMDKKVTGGRVITLFEVLEETVAGDFELLAWACKDWQAEHKEWAASDRSGPHRYNDTQKVIDHAARLKAIFADNPRQRPARQAKEDAANGQPSTQDAADEDNWLTRDLDAEITPMAATADDDWLSTPTNDLAPLMPDEDEK